jgi:hypothetical protein
VNSARPSLAPEVEEDDTAVPPQAATLTAHELLLVDAIAERVIELLPRPPSARRLVDAATIAELLGVSRDTVYQHAVALGGRRLGDAPRGRLRFDPDEALEGWMHRSSRRDPPAPKAGADAAKAPSRRRRQPGSNARLLPVHGERVDLPAEGEEGGL